MRAWSTSTPGCPGTIRPSRSGWPTSACGSTTRCCWLHWSGRWWRRRPGNGGWGRRRGRAGAAAGEGRRAQPPVAARLETLNLAYWRASRSGLDDQLIHPVTGKAAPAENVLRAPLRPIGGALDEAEAATDRPGVTTDLLQSLLARGNGATQQRHVWAESGDLAAVVRNAVAHTLTVE